MLQLRSTLVLGLMSAQVLASLDLRFLMEKRQTANLSTGTVTSITSLLPSTTTVAPSSTSRAPSTTPVTETSQTITIQPSQTQTQTQTSVEVSVSDVTTTITPTNSAGSVTGTPTVVVSASSVSYVISYSEYVTSLETESLVPYTTTSNGVEVIATSTTRTRVPVTTSARVTGIVSAENSGGSSGLSDNSKKIIGGVVGGVGGALLLGALGFTAWRIWGKKKNVQDDDFYDPNQPQEKTNTINNNDGTPFRSTLDQYHQPGPVNTASNF